MVTASHEIEIQGVLAELRSADSKRRWNAICRVTVTPVEDERVWSALAFIASQDTVSALRDAARFALPASADQATLEHQARETPVAPVAHENGLAPVGDADKREDERLEGTVCCSACGEKNPVEAVYCLKCGKPLANSVSQVTPKQEQPQSEADHSPDRSGVETQATPKKRGVLCCRTVVLVVAGACVFCGLCAVVSSAFRAFAPEVSLYGLPFRLTRLLRQVRRQRLGRPSLRLQLGPQRPPQHRTLGREFPPGAPTP